MMSIFSESEIFFRLPVFIIGALSIPLSYLVGIKIIKSKETAFIPTFFYPYLTFGFITRSIVGSIA